jgi:hypothetical protein
MSLWHSKINVQHYILRNWFKKFNVNKTRPAHVLTVIWGIIGTDLVGSKSTSSSYPILVPFPIFRENFIKNIKKPPTADALYLDEGVGNE